MRRGLALPVLLVLLAAGCAGAPAPGPADAQPAWRFESVPAWQDEFDYRGKPDPARWRYDLGAGGWGNHELQDYTDRLDNAFVADGVLTIQALGQPRDGARYTSARLLSKGSGDFLYGRIEARAKLPAGRGTWPAIWMLPTDWHYGDWPRSGEIDIMEHVGFDPGRIHASVHTQAYNHVAGTQKTAIREVDDATTGFHLYRVDWTPDAIRAYVDDALLLEFRNDGSGPDAWPFDQRFHLLLNIAVGGDWGGRRGVDAAAFPARMQVDYVRVYRLAPRRGEAAVR